MRILNPFYLARIAFFKLFRLNPYRFKSNDFLISTFRKLGHYSDLDGIKPCDNYQCLLDEIKRRGIYLGDSLSWTVQQFEHARYQSQEACIKTPVNFEQFLALATTRQSVRNFKSEKIPSSIIQDILRAAIQAPSSCNRQPWGFKIVDRKDDLSYLSAIRGLQFIEHCATAIIIIMINKSMYKKAKHKGTAEIKYTPYLDAAAAIQNMLLAATTKGIGSCWVNMGDAEVKRVKMRELMEYFRIPDKFQVISLVALGYPQRMSRKPLRDDVESYVH